MQVDTENNVIRGVKFMKPKSRNKIKHRGKLYGRRYAKTAMQDANKLLEGNAIFGMHFAEDPNDELGVSKNPHFVGEDITGDWHYNPERPSMKGHLYTAQNHPNNLALSIEVADEPDAYEYEWDHTSREMVITRIHKLAPTAVVPAHRAGTTNGVFEQKELFETDETEPKTMKSVAEFKSEYPAIYEQVCTQVREEEKAKVDSSEQAKKDAESKVALITTELDQLKAKMQELSDEKAKLQATFDLAEKTESILQEAEKAHGAEVREALAKDMETVKELAKSNNETITKAHVAAIKESIDRQPPKKGGFRRPKKTSGNKGEAKLSFRNRLARGDFAKN